MSDNFPNNPKDSSLPDIGMYDPGTNAPSQSAGGKTKVRPSADAPHGNEQVGYGYMSPELKDVGTAPDGNSSGIPAAQPITPQVYGDPNNSAGDFPIK